MIVLKGACAVKRIFRDLINFDTEVGHTPPWGVETRNRGLATDTSADNDRAFPESGLPERYSGAVLRRSCTGRKTASFRFHVRSGSRFLCRVTGFQSKTVAIWQRSGASPSRRNGAWRVQRNRQNKGCRSSILPDNRFL